MYHPPTLGFSCLTFFYNLSNDTSLASRHPMFLVPRSRKIFLIQESSKESPQLQISLRKESFNIVWS
uniref:Uncharacterized protein n=1 Tax=Daphnia magna TaxID=35525 RepID=A0A0P6FQ82_9CRUS